MASYNPTQNTIVQEKVSDQTKKGLSDFPKIIPKSSVLGEEIPIEQALNRVLSQDVEATMDDPPYSKSLIEGYILLTAGTALSSPKRPLTFDVLGDIPPPSTAKALPLGKAFRVKSGSYLAIERFLEGHYAVLKLSEATEMDHKIHVVRFIEKYENIGLQGSVRRVGNILFNKGYRLRVEDIFTLANQAILKVKVACPPKVAILSIGNDLLSPTGPYKINYKYDCNAYGLAAMINASGGHAISHGIMSNLLPPLIKKVVELIDEVDMIILSGEIIAAQREFAVDLILGACAAGMTDALEIAHTQKAAFLADDTIRPTVMGIIKKKPIICLPGEMEAVIEGCCLFAQPMIGHLLGEERA